MSFRSLVKKLIPTKLFRKIEPWGHLIEAVIFNLINGFPARGLKVIGVTGTNGKTSTCFLIQRMLHEAGYHAGLMSTVGYGAGDKIETQTLRMTNVAVPEMMRRLKWMRSQKVEWLVLETTSHALAQHRVWGIPYSVAVMTNVTHEHLDYHGTFERYRDAKRMLFKMTSKNKKGLRAGVINADDPSAELFVKDTTNPVTYGLKVGDYRATNIKMAPTGSSYEAKLDDALYKIKCNLPGSFNVYNSLAAVGVGHLIGLRQEQVEQGISALESVPGRMTTIDEGQDFEVIIDYAHSPDAYEKLFHDLKPLVKGKLIAVFGSSGRRDTAKRPIQGQIAGKYADEVFLTEEDDHDEDGMQILEEIAAGAEKSGKVRDKNLFLIHDRKQAVVESIKRAKKGDMVLLLGKGHEKVMIHGPGESEIPYSEVETARDAIRRN